MVVAIDARRREDGSGWNVFKNGGRVDTGVDAVGERKVDETILTAIGDRWFCHFLCQGIQSAALSASQQHGDALFLDLHDIPPNINSKISFELGDIMEKLSGSPGAAGSRFALSRSACRFFDCRLFRL